MLPATSPKGQQATRSSPKRSFAILPSEVSLDELIATELVAPVSRQPVSYAFRHPLMRAVAYESQLKSDRVSLHRRIAAALELDGPAGSTANAALIATHREAAGDLADAY